jgi:hypothetical protein
MELPNASTKYRNARERLLELEIEPRRAIEPRPGRAARFHRAA